MNKNLEIIERSGKRFVVILESVYNELIEDAEMLEDVRAFDKAKARKGESFPAEFVDKLLDAKSPGEHIKLWREYRGLSKTALGGAIGKEGQYIGMIEAGKRKGTIDTLGAIAKKLGCDIDDLA